MRVKSQT